MKCTIDTTGPKYVNLNQGAQRSGLSVKTLRRLIARGALTAYRPVPGRLLLSVEQLDRLIEASTVKAGEGVSA
jgi:hypothetical protein